MCRQTKIWNLWYFYILPWFKPKGYFDIVYELMMWNSGMRSNNACLSKVLRWRVLCNIRTSPKVSHSIPLLSSGSFGRRTWWYSVCVTLAPSPRPRPYRAYLSMRVRVAWRAWEVCWLMRPAVSLGTRCASPLASTAPVVCPPTGCTYLTLTRRPCWINLP